VRPYYQDDFVTLYHGDWRDVPPDLLAADVLVTDPPYGTGGWRRSVSGAGSDPSGSLVAEAWDDGATDWLAWASPRPVLTFWPPARTSLLLGAAIDAGYTKHRAIYLRKPDPKPQVGGRTAWSVEPIWVLSSEGFLLMGGDDMWEESTPRLGRDADATGHPYQKPLGAMTWVVGKTRGTVLDPFAGSGTTLRAAKSLGRAAVGIEQDERWCEVAANRLRQDVLGLEATA